MNLLLPWIRIFLAVFAYVVIALLEIIVLVLLPLTHAKQKKDLSVPAPWFVGLTAFLLSLPWILSVSWASHPPSSHRYPGKEGRVFLLTEMMSSTE
jgi:hypothetical protein